MSVPVTFPNRLADARVAAGIDDIDDLARRAGIDPIWYAHIESGRVLPSAAELNAILSALGGVPRLQVYRLAEAQTIGLASPDDPPWETTLSVGPPAAFDYARFWRNMSEHGHLLVSRDEVTWLERSPKPDADIDAYINMSCSTQESPVLLLDTVAVCRALGISFVAKAGIASCCGKIYGRNGRLDATDRMGAAAVREATAWGASVHVNWCTACQVRFEWMANRDALLGTIRGDRPREQHVLAFLEERIRGMGTAVPWKRSVPRRVLVDPMVNVSAIHDRAAESILRLLALVPGVEVLGYVDRPRRGACIKFDAAAAGLPIPAPPATRAEVQEIRAELAAQVRARGADTVSCQHQDCHQAWSRYAGPGLSVRHAVSIVAEALGVANPDRYQLACAIGDPSLVVDRLRPVWSSWSMPESRALELATEAFDVRYATDAQGCACGKGAGCVEDLIQIDRAPGTPAVAERTHW
jgi:transcriptional regulator with XRE-family HTH domain